MGGGEEGFEVCGGGVVGGGGGGGGVWVWDGGVGDELGCVRGAGVVECGGTFEAEGKLAADAL